MRQRDHHDSRVGGPMHSSTGARTPCMLRRRARALLFGTVLACAAMSGLAHADEVGAAGPKWTANGELELPTGFHRWVFLGAPITPNGLNGGNAGFPEYHNVYVHPEHFDAYRRTGAWPEGTVMLKELQLSRPGDDPDGSSVEASGRGYFPGTRNGIDVSVKDATRFKETNGWGFFNFGHHAPPYARTAAAAPAANCAGCHMANATNMVFSKFYTAILDAKR